MIARVVALGQPLAGDDGVGWRVLERLAARAPAGAELIAARDASVLVELAGSERLIVVDALRAAPAGQVRTLSLEQIARVPTISSHGLGVYEALSLGRTLSQLSSELWLVAISIDAPSRFSGVLSPAISAAVELAAETVLGLLHSDP